MTKTFLNTLYVATQGAYVHLESDTVRVKLEDQKLLQVPLHHLGSICVFGLVNVSFPLLAQCAEDGRAVVILTEHGRFKARIVGKTTGNVLLRKAQYDFHADEAQGLEFAKAVVAGKLQNARQVLLRASREAKESDRATFATAADETAACLQALEGAATLDEARGMEGMAAQCYFDTFDAMITSQRTDFRFDGRSRRPPRDRVNSLLSFLYTLWTNDCVSALEGVGLDPQFGILHALRPGRPGLALDLVEEFRSVFLDRLCLSLINRKQVQAGDFEVREGGSVFLNETGRKKVLVAYQSRKQDEVRHENLKDKVPIGLLPHVQARMMARLFRGELRRYRPYLV
jgi:CRISPR-associated protein Cas1